MIGIGIKKKKSGVTNDWITERYQMTEEEGLALLKIISRKYNDEEDQ